MIWKKQFKKGEGTISGVKMNCLFPNSKRSAGTNWGEYGICFFPYEIVDDPLSWHLSLATYDSITSSL